MTITEIIDQTDESTCIDMTEIPGKELVLIQGDRQTFEFLGRIFLAFAESKNGDDSFFSPAGAGSAWFSKTSTKGFYLHFVEAKFESRRSE